MVYCQPSDMGRACALMLPRVSLADSMVWFYAKNYTFGGTNATREQWMAFFWNCF